MSNLRILSLNTALLSFLFDMVEYGLGDNNARAKLIGDKILNLPLEYQPDIILLQETFDGAAARIIKQIIKDVYPHFIRDNRSASFFVGVASGLSIASKYPIQDLTIEDYKCVAGIDAMTRKGIMSFYIKYNNLCIKICNTHLQAGVKQRWYYSLLMNIKGVKADSKIPLNKLTSDQVRVFQLAQAEHYLQNKNYDIILFIGDFNNDAYSDLQFEDPRVGHDNLITKNKLFSYIWNKTVDTYDGPNNEPSEWVKPKRIDYALQIQNNTNYQITSNIIPDQFTYPNMTDHKGIVCNINFNLV